jgi:hypothetical protein
MAWNLGQVVAICLLQCKHVHDAVGN